MIRTITVAILLSLMASTAVLADSNKGNGRDADARHESRQESRAEDRWDRRGNRREARDDRRDDRRHYRDHRRDDRNDRRHDRNDRRDLRNDWRNDRRIHVGTYQFPRGYRHNKWRRGDRLPRAYYARSYVVHDYHGYHLHAPPHGYHWVRVNQDVVLAAIATGVVLDVLYNHFY